MALTIVGTSATNQAGTAVYITLSSSAVTPAMGVDGGISFAKNGSNSDVGSPSWTISGNVVTATIPSSLLPILTTDTITLSTAFSDNAITDTVTNAHLTDYTGLSVVNLAVGVHSFSDFLASDAEFFVDPATTPGVERVGYTPRGGTTRTINAVVTRHPPGKMREQSHGTYPLMEISIRNHATLGVVSVNTGGDTVTLPLRVGGNPEQFLVHIGPSQDPGMWQLEVR